MGKQKKTTSAAHAFALSKYIQGESGLVKLLFLCADMLLRFGAFTWRVMTDIWRFRLKLALTFLLWTPMSEHIPKSKWLRRFYLQTLLAYCSNEPRKLQMIYYLLEVDNEFLE